jgi:predicted amidohydrolase YtcJ
MNPGGAMNPGGTVSPPPPDLILTGAEIFTDGVVPGWAEAMAVSAGRITAVGDAAEVMELAGPQTDVRDLAGRPVFPGFIDAHVHPLSGGTDLLRCALHDLGTAAEYAGAISRYAAEHPERPWIEGGGWSMDAFERGVPSAAQLDAVTGDRPAILANRDGHTAWVNTAALGLAGITGATPDPADGRIERDERGQPSGALHEGAMALVGRLVPEPTAEFRAEALLAAQQYLHSLGITGWQDAHVHADPDDAAVYLQLLQSGQLTSRVVGAQWFDRGRGADQLPEFIERRKSGSADLFRQTSIKVMLDGVCETHTAALSAPYLDHQGQPTGNTGISFFADDDLREYDRLLDEAGFQVHFHAVGDRATTQALDAVQAALAANGPRHNRHHIAHVQVVAPQDVPRFRRLGVTVNAQPLWARLEPQMTRLTLPFLGPDRGGWQYRFRDFENAGVPTAFGSDWPVSTPDPFRELHVAVNRTPAPDKTSWSPADGVFLPEQRLSLLSAVRAFTLGSAYVNHAEELAGSLAAGKSADFIVLDRNPFDGPPGDIWRTTVQQTWFAGQPVYQREPAA